MHTLVLGGIRSGKSHWAEAAITEAAPAGAPVRYLATATTDDDADTGWRQRILGHRSRRPPAWDTVESADVAGQLRTGSHIATLVDDIGGWLTAAMDRTGAWDSGSADSAADDLIAAVKTFPAPLVLVSPEVGLTVVPATEAGRRFADALGTLNQRLAAACDRVVLVVAGVAVPIKPQRGL
jgi:adenosylcobinamide kinase/adenosylcobinamide-phosphate guanylyltransferase